MLNVQCSMFNAQCSMLNAQCSMLNVQCSMLNAQLESRGFQHQSCLLVKTEHQVHILNSLTYRSFQQIVDAGNHQQLVLELLDIDHSLVGSH